MLNNGVLPALNWNPPPLLLLLLPVAPNWKLGVELLLLVVLLLAPKTKEPPVPLPLFVLPKLKEPPPDELFERLELELFNPLKPKLLLLLLPPPKTGVFIPLLLPKPEEELLLVVLPNVKPV